MTEKRTTESAESSHSRPTCNHSGCTTPLARNNTIGYCRQHRGDAKLIPQVCKRVGCSTRLTIRSKTGYCELHKSDANTKKPPLTDDELKEHQGDDRWELHHDERDTVACRICGKRMERLGPKGKSGHLLREHGLTVLQYHQYCQSKDWGTPPITSLNSQEAIAKWRRDHPEKVRAFGRTKNTKDKVRRRTDPQFRKHEGDQIRKLAQRKLTYTDKEVRVQCLVPDPSSNLPCGEWYRSLGAHLWAVHEMSVAAYNLLCPGAPTEAPDLAGQGTKVGEFSKKLWAERKQKLADAEASVKAAKAELAQAEAEVERLRNQQRDERDPLITLAVCLLRRGVKKGAMWAQLYPGHLKKAAIDKTKKLFKRRSEDMDAENSRISTLSESQCQAEAEWARSQISQQAHRPPAAA